MERWDETYVWQIPVRVTHWVIALAITVLCVTGLYIANPYLRGAGNLMLNMKATHLVFAVLLTSMVVWRVVWAFVGNRWSRWRAFVPFGTPGWWPRTRDALLFYLFLRRSSPQDIGHNALAALAYLAVYALLLVEIVTGFALNALTWGGAWLTFLGWVFVLLPINDVRLVHHLVMWLLLGFVVHHVYSAVLMDSEERTGIVSSIFTGYKTIKRRS